MKRLCFNFKRRLFEGRIPLASRRYVWERALQATGRLARARDERVLRL